MNELARLLQAIHELQAYLSALTKRSNELTEAIDVIHYGTRENNDMIAKHFAVINSDIRHMSEAFVNMSRRIDTLEILASKKFAEEIEHPFKGSEEKVGRC